jgi:hypothetical protein
LTGAWLDAAVEHGEGDGACHRKLDVELPQQIGQEALQAHRLPQPAEDPVRTQLLHGAGLQLPWAMGLHHPYPLSEPSEGAPKDIDPTQGGEHAQHRAPALTAVFDDL